MCAVSSVGPRDIFLGGGAVRWNVDKECPVTGSTGEGVRGEQVVNVQTFGLAFFSCLFFFDICIPAPGLTIGPVRWAAPNASAHSESQQVADLTRETRPSTGVVRLVRVLSEFHAHAHMRSPGPAYGNGNE